MVEQNNTQSPDRVPSPSYRGGRRAGFVIALVAVALLAGVTGNMLSHAFGQGFAWQHFHLRGGGPFGGAFAGGLSPAQVDDRIDRMTKHMAIELDATADQQAKIANARSQAVTLLTAPTIDRTAIERLRAEQIGLAETASKRIAQALADAAEVLNPEQRRKVADWVASGPWSRWHHG